MTIVHMQNEHITAGAVVPAFNGQAEKFVLRAVRLLRRSLQQVNGDAGKILAKHLRTRVPAAAVDDLLGDLTSLVVEIQLLQDGPQDVARITAKWPNKDEFFLLALIEACQRQEKGRASEAAIALLDTFEVGPVLTAAMQLGRRLNQLGLRLMPIGERAFSYFADYQPIDEPHLPSRLLHSEPFVPLLRVV